MSTVKRITVGDAIIEGYDIEEALSILERLNKTSKTSSSETSLLEPIVPQVTILPPPISKRQSFPRFAWTDDEEQLLWHCIETEKLSEKETHTRLGRRFPNKTRTKGSVAARICLLRNRYCENKFAPKDKFQ